MLRECLPTRVCWSDKHLPTASTLEFNLVISFSLDLYKPSLLRFYHVACFRTTFATRARLAVTDLPGFEQLSATERRTLNAQWQ